jgi:hypothetical protein
VSVSYALLPSISAHEHSDSAEEPSSAPSVPIGSTGKSKSAARRRRRQQFKRCREVSDEFVPLKVARLNEDSTSLSQRSSPRTPAREPAAGSKSPRSSPKTPVVAKSKEPSKSIAQARVDFHRASRGKQQGTGSVFARLSHREPLNSSPSPSTIKRDGRKERRQERTVDGWRNAAPYPTSSEETQAGSHATTSGKRACDVGSRKIGEVSAAAAGEEEGDGQGKSTSPSQRSLAARKHRGSGATRDQEEARGHFRLEHGSPAGSVVIKRVRRSPPPAEEEGEEEEKVQSGDRPSPSASEEVQAKPSRPRRRRGL